MGKMVGLAGLNQDVWPDKPIFTGIKWKIHDSKAENPFHFFLILTLIYLARQFLKNGTDSIDVSAC
jgi:hypothetical protein